MGEGTENWSASETNQAGGAVFAREHPSGHKGPEGRQWCDRSPGHPVYGAHMGR